MSGTLKPASFQVSNFVYEIRIIKGIKKKNGRVQK